MTHPLGSGLMRGTIISDQETDPTQPIHFQDNPGPGTDKAYLPYDTHTVVLYQNGLPGEVWGARKGYNSPPGGSSFWGWVDYVTHPNGYFITHAPGYHWHESTYGNSAYYRTNEYNGQTKANTSPSGADGPQDTSWVEYLGVQPPGAGHEDHTGGFDVYVNVGDFEKRTFWRARWNGNVPKTLLNARLYYSTQIISGNRVTDYNITADAFSNNAVGLSNPHGTEPFVTAHLLQGDCPYAAAADPGSFSEVLNVPMQSSGGTYDVGTVYLGAGSIDLGFVNGQLGNVGNGNLTDRYCNIDLFGDPDLARQPEIRYPGAPVAEIDYLFCPFHFGLVFLDGFKHNSIGISDSAEFNIGGVEVEFQTAPGWGWDSAQRYYWYDRFGNSTGPSKVAATHSSVAGGVLELEAVFGEEDDRLYGYREANVMVDRDDPAQNNTPSLHWAFEFVSKFEGGHTGDWDYGPIGYIEFGRFFMEFMPHLNEISGWWVFGPTSVDLYDWFHVRVVQSNTGWAVKIWQDGDSVPSAYTDWRQVSTFLNANPNFDLWQDGGLFWTSYPATAVKWTIKRYTFWDLTGTTDPLIFTDGNPSGGSVNEANAPGSGDVTTEPATMSGNGTTS